MPGDFIGFAVDGLDKLQSILSGLSEEIQDKAVDEMNKYLLNVLRSSQASKNYITRKAAYGKTFFTERQRKWFFANLNEGSIDVPYKRTQAMAKAWHIEGSGRRSFIANEAEGAPFVMGDDTQSRHEKMVGWKTVSAILKEHATRAEKKLEGLIDKILRRRGAR